VFKNIPLHPVHFMVDYIHVQCFILLSFKAGHL